MLGLVTFVASTAQAQQYPVTTGGLDTETIGGQDTTNLAGGTPFRVKGGGYAPGSQVTITIESNPIVLGTFTANAAGNIDVTVTIPLTGLAVGSHTIKATGTAPTGGTVVLSQTVSVTGVTQTPVTGQLPFTGAESRLPFVVGAALLGLGGVLYFAARRVSIV